MRKVFTNGNLSVSEDVSGDGERVGGSDINFLVVLIIEDSPPLKLCFVHRVSPQRSQKELCS